MRILIYFGHYETLGHTNRIIAIAEEMAKKHEVLIFNAGKNQDYFLKDVEVINLPHPYYGKEMFKGGHFNKKVDQKIKSIRLQVMKHYVKKFNPDLFITEFFPFGREVCKYEVIPFINFLKDINPKIRVIGSIGYPVLGIRPDEILKICELYDKLVIHSPKELDFKYLLRSILNIREKISLVEDYKKIFTKLADKIVFTGYVLRNVPTENEIKGVRKELNLDGKKLVVISRGGGVVYPKIISEGILSKKYLKEDVIYYVVSGPSTSDNEQKLFEDIWGNEEDIILKKYEPELFKYIAASDVSVSMTGYNTYAQLLRFNKSSIIIPKIDGLNKGGIEQIYRMNMMKDLMNSSHIYYKKEFHKELAIEIKKKLSEPERASKIKESWFTGTKEFLKIIEGLS